MKADTWSFLKGLESHIEINNKEREQIMQSMNVCSYKTNEILIKGGEVWDKIMFILNGAVCTYVNVGKGAERVLYFRFENQPLVDYNSFAHQIPTALTTIALEPTTVLWANHGDFFEFMASFPKYETVLSKILGRELSERTEQMRLLKIEPAKKRYETLCEAEPEIIKRVPLKYIASYLGIALETLSRIRAER